MSTRGKSNVPINHESQLQREAAEIAKRISAPSGDRIRFNANRSMITPDGMEGESFDGVIVDFIASNLYYDAAYDRDNPAPPGCFALGTEPAMLVPSPSSPNKQSDACNACPNNQFGSAGKGKACKNTRLVAVIPVASLNETSDAPIWILSVPPTSIKAFDSYVASLASKHKTIPLGVVTNISLDPGSTYSAPRFAPVRVLDNAEIGGVLSRREEAVKRLMTEPDVSQYVPPRAVGKTNAGFQTNTARRTK